MDAARASSVARKMAADIGVDLAKVHGTGPSGGISKAVVIAASSAPAAAHAATPAASAWACRHGPVISLAERARVLDERFY